MVTQAHPDELEAAMSEQPLERAEEAVSEGRAAADEAPIMPFDDAAPADPEESGGAVAEPANDAAPGRFAPGDEPLEDISPAVGGDSPQDDPGE
jgi:hypothetical protein